MPAGLGYAKPNLTPPPGWEWGADDSGQALGPTGQPITNPADFFAGTGSAERYAGGTTPDRNLHGSNIGSILSGLLGGSKFGGDAPVLPSTTPLNTGAAPPAASAPAPPPMTPEPKGEAVSGISPALRGVLTGGGGTDQTNIGALLAQLLKRPRMGV